MVWGGNDTTNHYTIFLYLEVGSALGGGIYAWVFDLCSGVLWFIAWLMFPHPFFVLEKNRVMSYFLTN